VFALDAGPAALDAEPAALDAEPDALDAAPAALDGEAAGSVRKLKLHPTSAKERLAANAANRR